MSELAVNAEPCRACGGRTHIMGRYVDDQGIITSFHDTCVGSWLSRFPQRSLQFVLAEIGTPIDLMEALKRSLAAVQTPGPVYSGPILMGPGALIFDSGEDDVVIIPKALEFDE